jgi:hypothetical protein
LGAPVRSRVAGMRSAAIDGDQVRIDKEYT